MIQKGFTLDLLQFIVFFFAPLIRFMIPSFNSTNLHKTDKKKSCSIDISLVYAYRSQPTNLEIITFNKGQVCNAP